MHTVIFGQDERVARFVQSQIPHMPKGFKDFVALGVEVNGKLVGGVVFHEYRGNDIQISCAATNKRWLTEEVIKVVFNYPFKQLRCERVTSFTPKNSIGTRRFLTGLGFMEEGNMRRGFLNDDCMIYGMLREECRWIKE